MFQVLSVSTQATDAFSNSQNSETVGAMNAVHLKQTCRWIVEVAGIREVGFGLKCLIAMLLWLGGVDVHDRNEYSNISPALSKATSKSMQT
eukprot:4639536-Amphidinium_carterae.1